MGSGSSKVVIKKATPKVKVNYDAVNGFEAEDKESEKNTREVEEKQYESPTLKDTEEKLKTLGYTDPILAQYCDETKEIFEEFIELYKCVEKIKKVLEYDQNFVLTLDNLYDLISTSYRKHRPHKIKKGEFLSALSFGQVCKKVYDKLIDAFPKLFTYDKEKNEVRWINNGAYEK